VKVWLHAFLTSALDGGEWSVSRLDHFNRGEITPGSHCMGGWVGPRAGLNTAVAGRKISSPRRESSPISSSPKPSRYNDCAIPAPTLREVAKNTLNRIYSKYLQSLLQNLRFSRRWRFNSRSSGLWRRVVLWQETDVSEELTTSVFRGHNPEHFDFNLCYSPRIRDQLSQSYKKRERNYFSKNKKRSLPD
jgi:hypothetical protein